MFEVKVYLFVLIFSYLSDGFHAVSNEINHKSNRFNFDYCEAGLCASNKKHIGCINKGRFGRECTKDVEVVKLDDYQKNLIVYQHNLHRNSIALGKVPRYPSAKRMGALQWDDELAYLAELNAMSCEIEHDKCRNTRSFPFAGQNLALGWLLSEHTIDWTIKNFTDEWFIEHKDANPQIIDSFYRPGGPPVGHFTLMVNDKQSRVGCGLVKFTKRQNNWNYKVHVMTCNYSWTNVFTFPVYKKGAPASGCVTGKNPHYEGLCNYYEPIKASFF